MPKGQRLDDSAIMAVYEEVGTVAEAARRLDLNYLTVFKVKRRHDHLCVNCGKPLDDAKRPTCPACRELANQWSRNRIERQHAKQFCVACNEPALPGQRHCAKHAEMRRAVQARSRTKARKELGDEAYLAREAEARRKAMYGKAGARVWEKAQRSCAVCGAPYRKNFLHVHHIDGNRGNSDERNMIVLCKQCHMVVHHLLWHPNLLPVLDWIKTTYPSLPLT